MNTGEAFRRADLAFKIDGYYNSVKGVHTDQALESAKKELLGHLKKDIKIIEEMDLNEFLKWKRKDFNPMSSR